MQPRLMVQNKDHSYRYLCSFHEYLYFGKPNVFWILLAMLLGLIGCDSDSEDESSKESEKIELLNESAIVDSHLVLIDKNQDRAFIVDVAADDEDDVGSSLEIVQVAPNPFWIESREGSDSEEVLILSAGRRGVTQPTVLSAMGTDGSIREYEVGAPFDSLIQSEDGRYAFLYFSRGSDELLFSLNEIAVVDLDTEGGKRGKDDDEDVDEGVFRESIDTSTGTLSYIALSPTMRIGKKPRVIATVLDEDNVILVDLVSPKRNHTVVKLNDGKGRFAAHPKQVLFNKSRQEIYVRGDNADDIFILSLEPIDNDYTTEVYQIPVGSSPTDMGQYGEDEDSRLLVVSRSSKDVHIINFDPFQEISSEDDGDDDEDEDGGSGDEAEVSAFPEIVSIDLEFEAENVRIYELEKSKNKKEYVALLYKQGSRTVSLLDLKNIETYQEQNLTTITLEEPVLRVEEFNNKGLALVVHNSMNVDVIDVETGTVRTVWINSAFRHAFYKANSSRLWIVPPNQHFISYVDLDTGSTNYRAVLLDYPIDQFLMADEDDLVVTVHQGVYCETDENDDEEDEGDEEKESEEDDCVEEPFNISILDSDEPSRDSLILFSDFSR